IKLHSSSATSGAEAEIFVDGNSLGAVAVASGDSASVTTPALAVGSHGIMIRNSSGTFDLQTVKVQAQ
ncbi:MAG: hypothetical protein ACRD3S_07120, partial [Terracidiphilus sp.]